MPRRLITPSLYESYRWFMKLENKPIDEFRATLEKIKTPTNEDMQAGIDFEDYVRGAKPLPANVREEYRECVLEITNMTFGGLWQQSFNTPMEINGKDYLLYCRSDVILRDWVYDVKFSGSYEINKYFGSCQHLITMKASGIEKFRYAIADGKCVACEDYFWHDGCEDLLHGRLAEMIEFIDADPVLKAAYDEKWQSQWQ